MMVANITLLAGVVIFSFSGLPTVRVPYRAVVAILSGLCWVAAAEWFGRFATSTDPLIDRWPWLLAMPGWVLGCAAMVLLAELLTLRRFHERRKMSAHSDRQD